MKHSRAWQNEHRRKWPEYDSAEKARKLDELNELERRKVMDRPLPVIQHIVQGITGTRIKREVAKSLKIGDWFTVLGHYQNDPTNIHQWVGSVNHISDIGTITANYFTREKETLTWTKEPEIRRITEEKHESIIGKIDRGQITHTTTAPVTNQKKELYGIFLGKKNRDKDKKPKKTTNIKAETNKITITISENGWARQQS